MYRERKTWSSRKFGESKFFFGEDDVFQMKEFRTTLIYIYTCMMRILTYVFLNMIETYMSIYEFHLFIHNHVYIYMYTF